MIKDILVPTDFSKCSVSAVKVAAQLAKKLDATIHLLHVIETPVVAYDAGMVNFESLPQAMFMKELADDNMKSLLNEGFLQGISVESKIEYDAIYTRINHYVEKNDIQLIVMGSHGAKGFNEIVLGSNAERVVRYSSCPVLTIKQDDSNFDVKNIVVASDFNSEADEMFKGFKQFTSLFKAKLHLIRVNTPVNFETTPESKEKMKKFADRNKLENFTMSIYNDTTEEDGVLNYADEINADLLLIGTHGRTGLAHLIKGSIAEDLLNHSKRAVLSIKLK
ncbi:MAG: universal stress protein [Flavobacteriales bacterium]|nr:universal stress protein [Flavobacteriales bacterium]MCB9174350.1 universal stress protein [Flavobacteriales bacterium]